MAFNWDLIKVGDPEMNNSENFFTYPDIVAGIDEKIDLTKSFNKMNLDSKYDDDDQENQPKNANIIPAKKKPGLANNNNGKPKKVLTSSISNLYEKAKHLKNKQELARKKIEEETKRNRIVFHSKPAPKFTTKPRPVSAPVKVEAPKAKKIETPDVLKPLNERRHKVDLKRPISCLKTPVAARPVKTVDRIKIDKKPPTAPVALKSGCALKNNIKKVEPKPRVLSARSRIDAATKTKAKTPEVLKPLNERRKIIQVKRLTSNPKTQAVTMKPKSADRAKSILKPLIVPAKPVTATDKPYVFTAKPYKPSIYHGIAIKRNAPNKMEPFNLKTGNRAVQRKLFDDKFKLEMEQKKNENDKRMREAESVAIKELRKTLVFRANPNPFK